MNRRLVTLLLVVVGLLFSALLGAPTMAQAPDPVEDLTVALDEQITVNMIVGDPELGQEVAAIRNAVQEAQPHAAEVQRRLEAALGETSGEAQQFVQMALDELASAMQLAQLILTGPADMVVLRHGEMQAHGGVTLAMINLALHHLGAGPSAPSAGHILQEAGLEVPAGFRAEIVVNGLNFASVVAVDEANT
ncbi:MAG: hypothetical protein M3220_10815, partial [Chloroflexota bacterium]|nr:hypothetical protein [Chloroflexota bacterium]